MTILINPARFRFGADTAIGRLLGDEPSGLAIDFISGEVLIRDQTIPVVNTLTNINSFLTYAAPATKRIFNSSGVMVAGTTLRCDHDPAAGWAPRGVLIEGARTNKILRSQEFGTTWVPLNATVASDAATAPDGTVTGDRLTATSATTPQISQAGTGGANVHTFSVHAKAGTATWLRLTATTSGNATDRSAWFDLANGVVGSKEASVTWHAIHPAGNGWYRCAITLTQAVVSETMTIRMVTGDLAADGVSGQTVDLWGAQWEAVASFVSSYIPTTTASVARAVDTVSFLTSSFPHNGAAFTFMAECIAWAPSHVASSLLVWQMTDGTSVNRVETNRTPGNLRWNQTVVISSAFTMQHIVGSLFTPFVPHRMALSLGPGGVGMSGSMDGIAAIPETLPAAVPTALTTVNLPSTLDGHWRKLVILPRAAADSELPRLSALAA